MNPILYYRKREELTHRQLAVRLCRYIGRKVSPSTILRWERGEAFPKSGEERKGLAACLGIPEKELAIRLLESQELFKKTRVVYDKRGKKILTGQIDLCD